MSPTNSPAILQQSNSVMEALSGITLPSVIKTIVGLKIDDLLLSYLSQLDPNRKFCSNEELLKISIDIKNVVKDVSNLVEGLEKLTDNSSSSISDVIMPLVTKFSDNKNEIGPTGGSTDDPTGGSTDDPTGGSTRGLGATVDYNGVSTDGKDNSTRVEAEICGVNSQSLPVGISTKPKKDFLGTDGGFWLTDATKPKPQRRMKFGRAKVDR